MHPWLAVFSALQFQAANTGELKCNCFKNTSTLLCMENIFCEPSLLTKQVHPCREEAGCATCPNSSRQLLSFPSVAGQSWHDKAGGQWQHGKQATMAEENKHGSVSPMVQDSAFHSDATGNTVIATCQSRYPVTGAVAEDRELKQSDAAVPVGLCTQETTGTGEKEHSVHQHAEVIIPKPNKTSTLRNTNLLNPFLTIGISIQVTHHTVPDPRSNTAKAEKQKVFSKVFRTAAVVLGDFG